MVSEKLKKAESLERYLGFNRKFRGKTRTFLLEVCFNCRGRFIKLIEFIPN